MGGKKEEEELRTYRRSGVKDPRRTQHTRTHSGVVKDGHTVFAVARISTSPPTPPPPPPIICRTDGENGFRVVVVVVYFCCTYNLFDKPRHVLYTYTSCVPTCPSHRRSRQPADYVTPARAEYAEVVYVSVAHVLAGLIHYNCTVFELLLLLGLLTAAGSCTRARQVRDRVPGRHRREYYTHIYIYIVYIYIVLRARRDRDRILRINGVCEKQM